MAVASAAIEEGLSRYTFSDQNLTECNNFDELKVSLEKK